MPIIDTVVLFAAADAVDRFHRDSSDRLSSPSPRTMLGTFALVEFDVVLRSNGYNTGQRSEQMLLLLKDFSGLAARVHPISPATIAIAARLEGEFELDYFDSLLAAESMELDGAIVSSDRAFDRVPGLKRVPLVDDDERS